jgi:hypothetical protein
MARIKKTLGVAQIDTLGLDSDSDEECSLDGSASVESRNDIKLGEEFDTVYRQYKTACKALKWNKLFHSAFGMWTWVMS